MRQILYICFVHMSTTHAKDVHRGMDMDDSEKIEGENRYLMLHHLDLPFKKNPGGA